MLDHWRILSRPHLPRFNCAMRGALAAAMWLAPGLAGGGSIFDDDYKPPPDTRRPTVVEPPAQSHAPQRRLPPAQTPDAMDQPSRIVTPSATPATPSAPATTIRPRWAIPTADRQAAAQKLIHEVFKAEFAIRSPASKLQLSRQLSNEAQANDDAATQFVLYSEARDASAAAGDLAGAVWACRALRDRFNYAPAAVAEMEHAAIATSTRNLAGIPTGVLTPQDAYAALRVLMLGSEADLAAGRYQSAASLANDALAYARHSPECGLYDCIAERADTLAAIAMEFDRIAPSLAMLKTKPDDPNANLAVGKFYALAVDQPQLGLPMLAKGADATLKAAASAELLKPDSPTAQAELADLWAKAMKTTRPGPIRDGVERQALKLYDAASANANGLALVALQKHSLDLRALNLRHGLLGEFFHGQNFESKAVTRVDERLEFQWKGLAPDPYMPASDFSARWTGFIKAPVAGDYKFVILHDDGARISIDGAEVCNRWNNTGRDEAPISLTGELQQIKIEFNQSGGDSYFALGWIPPRSARAVSIPLVSLFHEPLQSGPFALHPISDGGIVLESHEADIHGRGAAYRTGNSNGQPTMEIGAWHEASTWFSWDFVATDGDYRFDLTNTCDAGNAGSVCAFVVGNARLEYAVEDTGGWDHTATSTLGTVHLTSGPQQLLVRVTSKPHESVTDLYQVTLTPIAKK